MVRGHACHSACMLTGMHAIWQDHPAKPRFKLNADGKKQLHHPMFEA